MKDIVIIGAGDFGKELVWLIEDINKKCPTYVVLGYLDDDTTKIGLKIHGYEVLGTIDYLLEIQNKQDICAVIAIQDGVLRKQIVNKLSSFSNWETIIHPNAVISDTVQIGNGTIACANVTISVDTVIGQHCIFYLSSTIGNDCLLNDYVSIMSNTSVSEYVEIGQESYLAANTSVFPNKKIGCRARIGVGSIISKDIKNDAVISNSAIGFNFFR